MKRRAVDSENNKMIIINTWLFGVGSVLVFSHWFAGLMSRDTSLIGAISQMTMNDGILLSTVATMIGGLFYSIVILRPTMAKRQRERELLKLTMETTKHADYTDQETGLYNRVYLEKSLNAYLEEFALTHETLGLYTLEILNDPGNRDFDIVKTGHAIVEMFRDYDVVARVGEHRFAIITPHLKSDDVQTILKRFNGQVERLLPEGITFSIGSSSNQSIKDEAVKIINASDASAMLNKRLKFAA